MKIRQAKCAVPIFDPGDNRDDLQRALTNKRPRDTCVLLRYLHDIYTKVGAMRKLNCDSLVPLEWYAWVQKKQNTPVELKVVK
jgi:hypothetical protein